MGQKIHFRGPGERYPICGVLLGRATTHVPGDTTCLSCVFKMRKAGVPGTPSLAVRTPGRRPGTRVRRFVHEIGCDMDEDCTCSGSFKAERA